MTYRIRTRPSLRYLFFLAISKFVGKVHEFRQQILQQTLSSVLQQNYCRFPRTQENCFLDVRLKLKTSIILFTATERQSQRVHVLSRICAQRTFYPGKFEKIKESTRDLPHLQSCFFLYFACCWISIVVQDLSNLVLVPEQVKYVNNFFLILFAALFSVKILHE